MKFNLDDTSELKTISSEWDFSKDGDAQQLEADMIDFMKINNGIGLAANQVGLAKRVFVMGHDTNPDFPKPFALFNPEILEHSTQEVLDQEGCLSFPGVWLSVKRPEWVKVKYFDSSGIEHTDQYHGYVSKCFQHELDHLNGVCFVDKVSKLKLQLALKKQRKNTQ